MQELIVCNRNRIKEATATVLSREEDPSRSIFVFLLLETLALADTLADLPTT